MTCHTTELDIRYRAMLSEYLAHPDEALLERAYGLGREALASGRGVLDMATMHSQAMAAVLASTTACRSRAAVRGARAVLHRGHLAVRDRASQLPGRQPRAASAQRRPRKPGQAHCLRASRRSVAARRLRASGAGRRGDTTAVRARSEKFNPCAACSIRSKTASGASLTSCVRRSSTTWDCCRRSNSWPTGSRSGGAFP